MIGWQTLKRKKNGVIVGREKVWLYKDAAEYFIQAQEKNATFAKESWSLSEIEYDLLDGHVVLIKGKKAAIDPSTRVDLVKYFALLKLTDEEKIVLGIASFTPE